MPEPLSLSEVSDRIQNASTLIEIENYINQLLPQHAGEESHILARELWNRRDTNATFNIEYQAQWNALIQRLRTQYAVIEDLEQKAAERENQRSAFARSNMMREGEVRIKIEKELNDQLKQRAELQKSIRREEMGQPMVDPELREQRSGSGVDNVVLRQNPPRTERVIPPLVSEEDRAAANALEDQGIELAGAGAVAGGKAAAKAGVWAAQKVGKAGFWAARKAASAAKKTGQAVNNGLNTPVNVSGENLILWIFFILTLILHIVLVQVGMQLQWFIYLFGAIGLGVLWWAFQGFDMEELKYGLGVSFVAGIPYLLASLAYKHLSNTDYINSIVVLAMIIAVWPLFLIAKLANRNRFAFGVFWLYRVILVILVLVLVVWPILAEKLGALPPIGDRVDVGGATTGFWDLLTERWARVTNRLSAIGQLYTNPDYYTGRVDENQGKPLGVTISDMRPLDEEIANDTAITMFANVETKSFVGESAQIVPSCVIDRTRDTPAVANIDPAVLDVVYGTTGSFECSFDAPTEGWRRGVYSVKASATFPFQTWAYIPYVFVDEERARNIARQGQDLRNVLDIDQDAEAVYTSGPVMMGMGGTDQPILVRRDDDKNGWLAPGSRIGVTLDSGWQDGEITAVHALELKVPEGFVLTACDREVTRTEADPNAVGYTSYVFENPPDTSVAIDYLTITCKLGLTDAEAAGKLVSSGDKAERTFVAVARYDYTTEEEETVRVR